MEGLGEGTRGQPLPATGVEAWRDSEHAAPHPLAGSGGTDGVGGGVVGIAASKNS